MNATTITPAVAVATNTSSPNSRKETLLTSEYTPYHRTYRRTLLDMHIPDWDDKFLSEYDPERLADIYAAAGINGALYYCKSHIGLNYWPAPVGGIHPAAKDRDLVGELHQALRERGIAPAAYHSIVFDNWAVEHHPEWAIKPATAALGIDHPFIGPRYGVACMNNSEYLAYELEQISALVRRYDFDALWIDMLFWPAICVCDACRSRHRDETGEEIPETIDWTSPAWARFQQGRERWADDFYQRIIEAVRAERPGLPITHNLIFFFGWFLGTRAERAQMDTFPAGDFYGGRDQQLLVSKLMLHLSEEQRAEFMTSRTVDLGNHTALKSEHEMLVQALCATAHSAAFLFIDAIDPVGTVNEGVYRRIGRTFARTAPYEQFLGGTPVEDIALYFSDDSRMTLEDKDTPIERANPIGSQRHLDAIMGASGKLQAAHLPYGVITRQRLGELARYRVVVLPDVVRMRADEIEAFRAYVAGGGRLYASGRTSLLDADGQLGDDFALADVFGCNVELMEEGAGIYVRGLAAPARQALYPEEFVSHGFSRIEDLNGPKPLDVPRLARETSGTVLATLTLPYGYPSRGSRHQADFASIHSSPPWEDRDNPTIVDHSYGDGRCVYSAVPIEAGDTEGHGRLFGALISDLLEEGPTVEAATHPKMILNAFDQTEAQRVVISLLEYDVTPPTAPVPARLRYRPGADRRVVGASHALTGAPLPIAVTADGSVELHLDGVDLFDMVLIDYEPVGNAESEA
jgi:Alpha-L-fucosidase/Beta-galactosidase trimerisation domain